MQTFEEFHVSRQRQRSKENNERNNLKRMAKSASSEKEESSTTANALSPKRALKHSNDSSLNLHENSSPNKTLTLIKNSKKPLGASMESYEVQLAIVTLIYLDLLASTCSLLLSARQRDEESGERETMDLASLFGRVLQSFTGFTVFSFVLELVALVFAFGMKFFTHIGYVVDTVVVGMCLCCEVLGAGKQMRILGFIRVWRLGRLVNSVLNVATAEHDATKTMLHREQLLVEKFKEESARNSEGMKREINARKQVEQMLHGYKDEVVTLNEALKIAAFDIAGVAYDELMEQNEASDHKLVDDEGDEFYDDGDDGPARVNKETIVVNEDGTFERT